MKVWYFGDTWLSQDSENFLNKQTKKKSQGISNVQRIYILRTMNILRRFNLNPSSY